ncbi:MAG: amidohydrolase [Candidatus Magnetoglobus multicellularis str. Araruama]|uniref:Amidohydrolase n=1 Tax=Candidatus Magnetoglobus multicellularis str. Araruama TaxID=890399 RepID=A0A1V1PH98_9BACT|nr:MAG: amidohydrolase [Candidatus Magnetoglobus multicellularis str. Araruama]
MKYSFNAASIASMPGLFGCAAFSNGLPYIDSSRPFILKNVRIIDVITGEVLENHCIQMQQGKITEIFPVHDSIEPSIECMDLKGRYVCPGLIDAHCHSTITSVFAFHFFSAWRHLRQQQANFRLCIESGITTIRDVGAMRWALEWYIERIQNEWIPGPRVVYCNAMLNIKGGHPEVNPTDISYFANAAKPFIGIPTVNFESIDELKQALQQNSQRASFIKLTVDPISAFCKADLKIPVYTDAHLKIIFDFAEKNNLPVICHNMDKVAFDRMIQYPVHSLEHVVTDAYLSDQRVSDFSKKNIAVIPTLTVGQSFSSHIMFDKFPTRYKSDFIENEIKIRQHYLENEAYQHIDSSFHALNQDTMKYYQSVGCKNMWEQKIFLGNPDKTLGLLKYGTENLKKFKDAGVLIGVGMDAGMPFCYFGSLYRELELLSRVGFTNHEILRAVTYNNAKILNMSSEIGHISKGKYADLVVYDKNPLDDIRVCRSPKMVLKDGKIVISKLQYS